MIARHHTAPAPAPHFSPDMRAALVVALAGGCAVYVRSAFNPSVRDFEDMLRVYDVRPVSQHRLAAQFKFSGGGEIRLVCEGSADVLPGLRPHAALSEKSNHMVRYLNARRLPLAGEYLPAGADEILDVFKAKLCRISLKSEEAQSMARLCGASSLPVTRAEIPPANAARPGLVKQGDPAAQAVKPSRARACIEAGKGRKPDRNSEKGKT